MSQKIYILKRCVIFFNEYRIHQIILNYITYIYIYIYMCVCVFSPNRRVQNHVYTTHISLTINLFWGLSTAFICHHLKKKKIYCVFNNYSCTLFMENGISVNKMVLFVIPVRSLHGSSRHSVYQALKRRSIT